MNRDRFTFFPVTHLESDLLTGVWHNEYRHEMIQTTKEELIRLRRVLMEYSRLNPSFFSSHIPIPLDPDLPQEITTMIECGGKTGTGPMSSVAGLFASMVAKRLNREYDLSEIVVENGGDLHIKNKSDLISVIHAGKSMLSDKLTVVLPPGSWGVCTSSGTMGHSVSYGRADAVTVIAEHAPLADAWATEIANRLSGEEILNQILDEISEIPDILGCIIMINDKLGIRGQFEVKPLY